MAQLAVEPIVGSERILDQEGVTKCNGIQLSWIWPPDVSWTPNWDYLHQQRIRAEMIYSGSDQDYDFWDNKEWQAGIYFDFPRGDSRTFMNFFLWVMGP